MQRGDWASAGAGGTGFNPHPTRRPGATSGVQKKQQRIIVLFQSSPDPKAGCNFGDRPHVCAVESFNPHPTRRPGATRRTTGVMRQSLFQSSPDPKAGCNFAKHCGTRHVDGFNPHPTRRPGATRSPQSLRGCLSSFNPHPTRRPGATFPVRSGCARKTVSILTRPEGRVQRTPTATNTQLVPVSILTRPEGRVQPAHLDSVRIWWDVSILTRPEGRVQRP